MTSIIIHYDIIIMMNNRIYHRKKTMLKNIPDVNASFLIDFFDAKFYHKFTYVEKNVKLFQKLSNLSIDGKYYANEIVIENTMRKPYLDCEYVYENETIFNENYAIIITKLQANIIRVFKQEYNIDLTIQDILLLDSSGKVTNGWKISLHIIISPSSCTYYYTNSKNGDSCTFHFYQSLIKLNPSYAVIIDSHVYNRDVNLRIIGSSKNGCDTRILMPIDPVSLSKINITNTSKLAYMLTYIDSTKPLQKLITAQTDVPEPTVLIEANYPIDITINIDIITKLVLNYHPSAYFKEYKNNCYQFNYKNRQEICPINNLYHYGETGFYCYISKTNCICLRCYSPKCTDYKILSMQF